MSEPLVLWNACVIDALNPRPVPGVCLSLRDGRIEEVRPASGDAPPGAHDLRGGFVMPGLIDAHIHLGDDHLMLGELAGPERVKGEESRPRELLYFVLARAAGEFLRHGVTTIRDVGCYDDSAIALREAIRLGVVDGPTVLSCGRIISATSPGGRMFGTMYEEADGPWDMRRCVRNQVRRGADYIKVMAGGARSVARENPEVAQLTREEMAAVVDEAHRLGLRVAAHAEGLEQVRLAVEGGCDTIEHGLSLHREPALMEQMAKRGAVLVPTLTTFNDVGYRFCDHWDRDLVEQARRQAEEAATTVRAARNAGVTVAMGFDSGPPGLDANELLRLIAAGLTAHEAITAATLGSARALGLGGKGTIEVGRDADLVVLDVNPLETPEALVARENLRMVVKAGRIVAGREHEPRPVEVVR